MWIGVGWSFGRRPDVRYDCHRAAPIHAGVSCRRRCAVVVMRELEGQSRLGVGIKCIRCAEDGKAEDEDSLE